MENSNPSTKRKIPNWRFERVEEIRNNSTDLIVTSPPIWEERIGKKLTSLSMLESD
jgi:DNA modification methylase